MSLSPSSVFFFFNDTATTEIYTLSLHDALPISSFGFFYGLKSSLEKEAERLEMLSTEVSGLKDEVKELKGDRKSTRLNSSHQIISYAVFCLKKKKIYTNIRVFTTNFSVQTINII